MYFLTFPIFLQIHNLLDYFSKFVIFKANPLPHLIDLCLRDIAVYTIESCEFLCS
jgi:hypothetical protein